jgi:predicted dehydrogenase/NADPH:quinone reductase-like Zn-dependent oxidoreductase
MKQILQFLRTGVMEVAELPCPQIAPGHLLIQTTTSLISAGTERMLVEFSKANLIQKARLQPDKVKQVLDKIRTDGLMPTLEAVFRKLDVPLPLGYCNVGTVLEVGAGVRDFQPGDRVASNGPHAEIACVPRNLCAKIPDTVTDEQAAFTVLGSIALQGVRLAQPTLGERFLVMGVGLVGLLTAQFLLASGCEVLVSDFSADRLRLAEAFGAQTVNLAEGGDPIAAAQAWTHGQGVDGVLITASAKTDEIVHQAAEACRKRGRIILVGVVGLNLRRSDFYAKELTFQVSCSYGPGRYDEKYEQGGQDYPAGYVRWTEQRNFEAVLGALRSGKLSVEPLITDRFPLADAVAAYEKVESAPGSLGVLLQYPTEKIERSKVLQLAPQGAAAAGQAVIGVIGAGNFAQSVLFPLLQKIPARRLAVADLNAMAARHAAQKFGFEQAVTDYKLLFNNPDVCGVFIVVGPHLHAPFLCEALEAGKHVYVEKPLALNAEQLAQVIEVAAKHPNQQIMVGFNRRFSPHTQQICKLLKGRSEPLCMNMTINAGAIPPDHWIQDPKRGGGRIISEGCHFIDLLSFLADSPVATVSAIMVGEGPAVRDDRVSIVLGFADGSVGTVNYFANGAKSYPKEMLEVFSDGRVLRMENFRATYGYGFKGFSKFKTSSQDKGHAAEIGAFVERLAKGGEPLIPFNQLVNVTQASFAALASAQEERTIRL